jgi:putative ABC transport system permease protein
MPDYILDAVRSINGVRYAVPVYSGAALVKLRNGVYQPVYVLGLDDASLFGRPDLLQGHIEDIYAENAFIVVKDEEFGKLGEPALGTEFEINDHRGVIVGIATVASSGLFGIPTLYTTFNRAIQYIPSTRYTISYILVEPRDGDAVPYIKQQVQRLGYDALTKDEFTVRTSDFYMFRTGVGTNILLMTAISFLVGLSISGQTFYTFVLENLDKFGALKAIGAKGYELVGMILFQVGFTTLAGYGLGIGLCAVLIALAKVRLPDYAARITFTNLGLAFGMVLIIAAVSGYIAVRKVLKIEPFDIFRG